MSDFQGFPKIPRLFRDCTITEKIDGTNACVVIEDLGEGLVSVSAQSRTRFVTPEDDNFGFAAWVQKHSSALIESLGIGRHFGEWWGSGIQRGYGFRNGERFFSPFNTFRWNGATIAPELREAGLRPVPVLYEGSYSQTAVDNAIEQLRYAGSFLDTSLSVDAEGVIVYHHAAKQYFKVTLKDDQRGKEWGA